VSPFPITIWTIGHSTRSIEEFTGLLGAHGIGAIADVRRHPGSRAHPQFNVGPLATALEEAGILYESFPELGGRRRPRADSPNTVWRNPSFRGYADHMAGQEYRCGMARLLPYCTRRPTALMCSEAVWWRCHRAMISDDLKSQGLRVLHVMSGAKAIEHPYTSPARIVDGRLHYGAG